LQGTSINTIRLKFPFYKPKLYIKAIGILEAVGKCQSQLQMQNNTHSKHKQIRKLIIWKPIRWKKL